MTIENTQDPNSMDLTAMLLLATGDTDTVIRNQEHAGQRQLVHSTFLPTELRSPREEFEALGFTFGEPDPHDPLFTPTTLPDGWKKEGSDHDMWSYVVDQHGRRRVGVFYKAAFYDRRADMHVIGLRGYVNSCVYDGKPIVTDDTWATREAVADAAVKAAAYAEEQRQFWAGHDDAEYVAQYTAERDKYRAVADAHAS